MGHPAKGCVVPEGVQRHHAEASAARRECRPVHASTSTRDDIVQLRCPCQSCDAPSTAAYMHYSHSHSPVHAHLGQRRERRRAVSKRARARRDDEIRARHAAGSRSLEITRDYLRSPEMTGDRAEMTRDDPR